MKRQILLPSILLLICAGCELSPKYVRPERPVPESWSTGGAALDATAADEPRWEDCFTHPGLQSIIKMALENNLDLKTAALNVEKMQAAYRIQASDLWPDVGVMGSGNRSRSPEKMNSNGQAKINSQYSVQVGIMNWELDFFGRLRSLKARALNQYLATEQGQKAARLSLVASLAQSYFTLAADQENLALAKSSFEAQKAYFEMISKSHELGVASELDLRQAQSQMETSRVDMIRFKSLVAMDRNALELLVGKSLGAELLPESLDAVTPAKEIPAGLASEVLLRRPDLMASEYQLKASYANIGAARAAFFPRISLTAGLGTMSPSLTDLFQSGTGTWSFQPQILAPIFAGGSLKAAFHVAKLDRDIAIAQYQKAIQSAFREVSDGLIRRAAFVEQLEAQQALVGALRTTYNLSEVRYKEGLDGYLGVLVSQRSLYSAQQALVSTRLAQQINQISLYKALGGQL